ncbi:Protein unc-50 -like protein [Halotydeus destructor]|nr:Protein unc-50 -like protein [Halotydeus destructor]
MDFSYSSSPLPEPATTGRSRSSFSRKGWKQGPSTALTKGSRFLSRLFRVDHMDFEFAGSQVFYLFTAPKKVFRNFQYRKQTKNQFARDDPAFLVLLGILVIASASALALVLRLPYWTFFKFLFWVFFVDFICFGALVTTALWYLSNKFLRKPNSLEDVEWGFAFDVHLNAIFPPLFIIHIVAVIFSKVFIYHEWFRARLLGNSFWFIASLYYIYITFLGYTSLMHLQKTKLILYSVIPAFLFYMIATVTGFNIIGLIIDFYRDRVV